MGRFTNISSYKELPWLLLLLLGINTRIANAEERQTYIIHMDRTHKPESFTTDELWHNSILKEASSDPTEDDELLLYSYSHVMHGFSARLTTSELHRLERHPAHCATHEESFGKLFTTHTSKFLGLKRNLGIWPAASYGTDVIIGMIDSGIWPESDSFSDKGLPLVPKRWTGYCENGTAFRSTFCNRKLIGARSFSKGLLAAKEKIMKGFDFDSPRDYSGHGTHTSSIAAGNHVVGASHFGYARGTASGIAPGARISMYKVLCASESDEAAATDVLAGMDQAISDGVDIISISLGFLAMSYYKNVIAIASLSAVEKGIFVVCAAGNEGPYRQTIYNGAPWIMTVGAGTVDRKFVGTIILGNGLKLEGTSCFPQSVQISNATLYYGKHNVSKAACKKHALDHYEVSGKVVLCNNKNNIDIYDQMQEVRRAGAQAGIFLADHFHFYLEPEEYFFPALVLDIGAGTGVKEYAEATNQSRVKVMRFMLTKLGIKTAPQVAAFSSRGPDPVCPHVLKPDIIAPGAEILGAIAPDKPFMEAGRYELVTEYALQTGTSMAAPHVAGVAALLKAVHKDWSPAAIRSAIMTTAVTLDNRKQNLRDQWDGLPATPLEFGAGHINPNRAMEPGLIYDMDIQDHIKFLCGLGYTRKQMHAVSRQNHTSCNHKLIDLNYPSFAAMYTRGEGTIKKFSRIVTNVGNGTLVYKATADVPKDLRIRIEPSILSFTHKYQKQSFVLSVEVSAEAPNVTYGFLKWTSSANHIVSSPIVAIIS